MSILVAGRTGQVARALAQRAAQRGLPLIALGRPELDLENTANLANTLRGHAPRVVINAAAYTAVDKSEDDAGRAFAINAAGAEAVARAAADLGAAFIQVSTDYVFAGDKPELYDEEDATGPTGVYGASKLAGERAVATAHPGSIIVRTAWVYDGAGANFVRTMLRIATTRDEVSVVSDQMGCPTYASDLADALLTIAQTPTTPGVFHCAGAGETNWADFAHAIFEEAGTRGGPTATVTRISTAEYPTRAKRPANSRLNCAKLGRVYGVRMRPWREALAACIDEVAAAGWVVQ